MGRLAGTLASLSYQPEVVGEDYFSRNTWENGRGVANVTCPFRTMRRSQTLRLQEVSLVTKKLRMTGAVVAFALALSACSGSSAIPTANGLTPSSNQLQPAAMALGPANGYYALTRPDAARPLCPQIAGSREWRCFGWIRTDLHPVANGDAIPGGVGYTPQDIQSAYNLDVTKGAGQRVYIIDAFGYKAAAADLAKYRSAAGLPACTVANKCLQVLNQKGKPSPLPKQPTGNYAGWMVEQSLDLDAVSATCPKCGITMIQANNSGTLSAAITAAVGLGGKIISMSFGGSEFTANPGLPAGIVFVASAGDSGGGLKDGGGPQQPCTFSQVVCVGGTALTHSGASWSEQVWDDLKLDLCGSGASPCGATGSACSKIVPKPSWQTDSGCKMRSAADVSADAAVSTPLAIFNSNFGGWIGVGGTSLAAPLIGGVFGLAGNASKFGTGASAIWKNHSSLHNVTVGTNVFKPVTGPCASSVKYICVAGKGYSGPVGWGTPNGSTNF